MSGVLFESEMLKQFGQLYPHVERLVIDLCKDKAYIGQIDLSHFKELQEFILNGRKWLRTTDQRPRGTSDLLM